MAQGRAWNKQEVIEALKPYWQLGYSTNKACDLAQVPQSTVQTWIGDDEELRLKIKAWQGQVSATARKNVVEKIFGKKETTDKDGNVIPAIEPDVSLSQWWLERKDKDEFRSADSNDNQSIELIATLLQKAYETESNTTEETGDNQAPSSESVQEPKG